MDNWITGGGVAFVAVADLWIAFKYALRQEVRCDECAESLRTEKK